MVYHRKLWQRKLLQCDLKYKRLIKRRWWQIVLTLVFITLVIFITHKLTTPSVQRDTRRYDIFQPTIDVVYTWVNGTDPDFIAAAKRFDINYDPARFDDKQELRYSLRSLERYAKWIRHVYIVTNGQIPNWLDLSYERVSIVPHEVLAPDESQLPTFSSAAIETFLHRIPKLSKRFLYLNDDIFLGAPLYPEDLYTESEGVHVYQAWMVPDCAIDCPWTYIGDGACDHHCNIEQCQYDGGDCTGPMTKTEGSDSGEEENLVKSTLPPPTQLTPLRKFPLHKFSKKFRRNATSFKELMRRSENSTLNHMRRVVDYYNFHKMHIANATKKSTESSRLTRSSPQQLKQEFKADAYSKSLINTNMLLNRAYGFKVRNVLAHVGFLIDRDIMAEMQQKFKAEVKTTAQHRFRSANDLQYAFAYYSFLMSEMKNLSVAEIFDEFDTDASGTWSDREVRTLLARIYPPPLDWSAMHFFEQVISNCSQEQGVDRRLYNGVYSTLVYERYEDSSLPTITRNMVVNCPLLAEALISNFAMRPKYKYNVNSKRNTHSNFMMLTSNVTMVVDALDKLRRNPKKFNCINDNLDINEHNAGDNELIRHLLEDFYLSFFPQRSRFELESQYRNRFTNWHDYLRWKRRKRAVLVIGYGFAILLALFLARIVCAHKTKCIRRLVQQL